MPLTGSSRDLEALACAFVVANRFSAHVEALFVRPDPIEAMPFYGEGMSSAVVQEIMDLAKSSVDSASRVGRANCEALAKDVQIEIVSQPTKCGHPTVSFREVEGNFSTQVTLGARLSDLVVFGPIKDDEHPGLSDAFDATLIETGRPVLVASSRPAADFTARIALAWNGSTASAHAISAALPFLLEADAVEVLSIKRNASQPSSVDALAQYLGLHGIVVSSRVVGDQGPIADVLLNAARSGGNGMLVAGGYGHNRMRELFVTGVTRRFVAQADIPCFLVH